MQRHLPSPTCALRCYCIHDPGAAAIQCLILGEPGSKHRPDGPTHACVVLVDSKILAYDAARGIALAPNIDVVVQCGLAQHLEQYDAQVRQQISQALQRLDVVGWAQWRGILDMAYEPDANGNAAYLRELGLDVRVRRVLHW